MEDAMWGFIWFCAIISLVWMMANGGSAIPRAQQQAAPQPVEVQRSGVPWVLLLVVAVGAAWYMGWLG